MRSASLLLQAQAWLECVLSRSPPHQPLQQPWQQQQQQELVAGEEPPAAQMRGSSSSSESESEHEAAQRSAVLNQCLRGCVERREREVAADCVAAAVRTGTRLDAESYEHLMRVSGEGRDGEGKGMSRVHGCVSRGANGEGL